MADEETPDDVKPEVPGGGNSKLILILILCNLIGLGGIGAYLVLFADKGSVAAQEVEQDPETYGTLVELPTLIVNLNSERYGRFMRVSLQMEARDDDDVAAIEAALIPIQNRMVIFFSEIDPETTRGVGAKDAIAAQVLDLANEVIGDDAIRRVFYTEFVVQ